MEGREEDIILWGKVDPNYIGISDNKLWKNMFGEIKKNKIVVYKNCVNEWK